ncbi:hypothetical protein E5676_scaffold24967G00050 [Cucumis melo var. makuwa]|uniref:Aminotransferase-like plant mobile domain-containing protein n=1 Tax=Cucumis melo var. makuwa TaxID=1194695 RepID=A0A5D3C1C3_CUCMM|nr:hypothetical protein E5676_scaffold24967G00050 [Cucumis melo var. makuwa]
MTSSKNDSVLAPGFHFGSFLRPGVFTAASLMATSAIYSLAVQVLANIYHGLGLITKASNLIGRIDFHFPMHYVHGWLAHYFGTHYPLPTEVQGSKMTNFSDEGGSIYFGEYEALELIHNGARIQWHANLPNRNKHECMVDTHDSSFLQTSYFDIPNALGGMPPLITPDNMLHHWRICTRRNTLSELYLSAHSLEPCKHVTQRFTDWWAMKHEIYFEDNIHHLVSSVIPPPSQPNLPKNRGSNLGDKEIRLVEAMVATLEDEINEHKGDDLDGRGSSALEVPHVPPLLPLNAHLEGLIELDSDESLTGPHVVDSAIDGIGKIIGSPPSKGDACPEEPLQKVSSTHAPLKYSESPLDASNKQIRRSSEHSQWVGEKVVSNFFKKTALCMWEDIQDKIMRTPFEYIPRLRPEITIVLSKIEKIHANGLTPLEEYLNSYLKRVDNFNDVQSSYSAQLLSTDKARQLDEKTSAIEATQLSLEKKKLERRLQSINVESEQLSILSCEKIEAIDQQELKVAKLQDEVNTLEGIPAITEQAIEALATIRKSMEAAQE